jgi:heptosyltransferase-2
LLRLAGARRVLGYSGDGRRLLLSIGLKREALGRRPHLAREYLALAKAAGASLGDDTPSLEIDEDVEIVAKGILEDCGLDKSGSIAGLCPGAAYGPSKRWPPERFVQVGVELAGLGLGVAVFGASSEAELVDGVAGAIPGAVSMAGKTSVLALAASLARCAVVVANDSGAAHLAAAVGAPVVAIFTSSDPSWTRPLGKNVRVLSVDLECSPCFEKECDIGYTCLSEVAPAHVVEAALSLTKGPL